MKLLINHMKNCLGTKKILAAMAINRVEKLVRITGALVNTNEFHPFVYLFNSFFSKSVKWHELTEQAIRASAVDYTVIRPTGIVKDDFVSKKNKKAVKVALVVINIVVLSFYYHESS